MNPQTQAVAYQGPVFNPRNGKEDYFFYATTPATLSSAAAQAASVLQFDADSQFLWIATSYQASIITGGLSGLLTEATNVIPTASIQIADGGSGKYLMNAPIPLGAIAGDGKRPYRLIGPRVIAPNSTLNFNWTYFGVAGTDVKVTLVLHGIKVYF